MRHLRAGTGRAVAVLDHPSHSTEQQKTLLDNRTAAEGT